jgi:hypothetical protein
MTASPELQDRSALGEQFSQLAVSTLLMPSSFG